MTRTMAEKADAARWATLTLLALLVLALAVETPFLLPASTRLQTMLFIAGLKTLPLLAFFPPVRHRRPSGAVWLGFLLMLYFCWAVLGLFVHGTEARFALARVVLVTGCFGAAMLFARWQRASLAS